METPAEIKALLRPVSVSGSSASTLSEAIAALKLIAEINQAEKIGEENEVSLQFYQ